MNGNSRKPLVIGSVIIMALFACNMALSHLTFVTNTKMVSVTLELTEAQRRVAEHRIQLARLTSSETIVAKAKKLGFEENPRVLYLMTNEFAKR